MYAHICIYMNFGIPDNIKYNGFLDWTLNNGNIYVCT